jgi:hypothetical protein
LGQSQLKEGGQVGQESTCVTIETTMSNQSVTVTSGLSSAVDIPSAAASAQAWIVEMIV